MALSFGVRKPHGRDIGSPCEQNHMQLQRSSPELDADQQSASMQGTGPLITRAENSLVDIALFRFPVLTARTFQISIPQTSHRQADRDRMSRLNFSGAKMDKLIRFLDIDPTAQLHAAAIWLLIEHRLDHIIEVFYADVRQSDPALALSDETVQRLKVTQRKHWRSLFENQLDLQYFNSASLVGIRHSQIGLDPKWYIVGYARIKTDFSRVILNADLPLATKTAFLVTLDKYVALDMALAISSYTSLLLD